MKASWRRVRKDLGSAPITEGTISGVTGLYVERYLLRAQNRSVEPLGCLTLAVQLGGQRIREGEEGHWRAEVIPSEAVLVPPECGTHWHYNGVSDFACFYFLDPLTGVGDRLARLAAATRVPRQFNDALVAASAITLVDELQKGASADEHFMSSLAGVMLEQAYRALTIPITGAIRPRHLHALRLQAALQYIREHLADPLSVEQLAELAGVSVAHFRRVFQEAMGVPPHRYIHAARLEQARKLLATSQLPIARIASYCGFSNQSHLTASFRVAHAATPAKYRAQCQR